MHQRFVDWLQAKRLNILVSTLTSVEKSLANVVTHMKEKSQRHWDKVALAHRAAEAHDADTDKAMMLSANISKLFNQPL